MQSDAIAFPKAALDQSMRKMVDFSSQSVIGPYFLVLDKCNFVWMRCCYLIQNSDRCHSHFVLLPSRPSHLLISSSPSGTTYTWLSCQACRWLIHLVITRLPFSRMG